MDESTAVECLARLAGRITVRGRLAETVQAVAEASCTLVPGCDLASVSLRRRGALQTAAATDTAAAEMDLAQYEFGAGPCVEAVDAGEVRVVADLAVSNWPPVAARAAAVGVHGVLTVPLPDGAVTFGALNLYTRSPREFGSTDLALARAYAVHAALAITSVRTETELREALATRQTIGQAVGMLMERHRLPQKPAFDRLARASQNQNVKIRDLAGRMLETGQDPNGGARPPRRRSAPRAPLLRVEDLRDGRVGMRVAGAIDVSTHTQLADGLRVLGAQAAAADVHLELGNLQFIDVTGARLLIQAAEQLHHRAGARLVLHDPPALLTQVAELVLHAQDLRMRDPLVLPHHAEP